MSYRNAPIRRKLMTMLLLIGGAVLVCTCASFFTYEFLSFRSSTKRNLSTLSEIIATNSTAALIFDNPKDATEILGALRAEHHIVAAAIYTNQDTVFARYPATMTDAGLPASPAAAQAEAARSFLVHFQPVTSSGKKLGTIYLRSDTAAITERFWRYGLIVLLVIAGSLLVAYLLSERLQRRISGPVLDLAETARAISERADFSVRATKHGNDELGVLTDAFNQMLAQLQERERALRESEARLRAVLNSALSAVIVTDQGGRIVDWNTRAEKMFGRSRGEAMGQDFSRSLSAGPDQPPLDVAAEASSGVWPKEMIAIRRDGSEFPVEVAINPLVSGGGLTFCSFITDITDRKKAQLEIQQLNQQLERRVLERTMQLESANKELEAFSYSVSHDLRAPLRHVDGFASMLATHAGPALDEKGRRYVGVIVDAARRMGRLIDDLLSFSRHGRAELQHVQVKLGDIVEAARQQLLAETPGRAIVWHIAPLPVIVGDAAMLHQVFINLIGNAVKYTKRCPEAVIEIGTIPKPSEIVVFVKDNGAGFNPKYANRLFGVFQRLHSDSEFEGTGVGLANVQRIVNRHGGRVWAEGEVDHGATFYLSLPMSQPVTRAS